jgi:hypothetical protein
MDVAVVIGTCGTPWWVHMGLESLRRHCSGVPCLVHDDSSPAAPALQQLCAEYGATFVSTPNNLGPLAGDLAAFVAGFDWCPADHTLVKLSRRFVPLCDWRPSLTAAWTSNWTYGVNRGTMYCDRGAVTGPIRTDCRCCRCLGAALHVAGFLNAVGHTG